MLWVQIFALASRKLTKVRNCQFVFDGWGSHSSLYSGSFNKVFTLRFDNQSEVIAKIPTKLVPPFYSTASEVATMDFVRNELEVPAPTVLAWNGRADPNVNPVGSEYIIMEKVKGVPLHTRWESLPTEDIENIIRETVDIQRRFTACRFTRFGSLYFADDVEPSLRRSSPFENPTADGLTNGRYRIGPLVDWTVWRGSRKELTADRGPCRYLLVSLV